MPKRLYVGGANVRATRRVDGQDRPMMYSEIMVLVCDSEDEFATLMVEEVRRKYPDGVISTMRAKTVTDDAILEVARDIERRKSGV